MSSIAGTMTVPATGADGGGDVGQASSTSRGQQAGARTTRVRPAPPPLDHVPPLTGGTTACPSQKGFAEWDAGPIDVLAGYVSSSGAPQAGSGRVHSRDPAPKNTSRVRSVSRSEEHTSEL